MQHKPEGFKELLAYRRAEELRLYARKLTDKLPYNEKRRIVHLNDSARSVKQNIVEGWKRTTTKEYYDFLSFSLGSLAEIKEDIKDLFEDKIISEPTHDFFANKCRELDYLLNRLRQSLYEKMRTAGTLPVKEKFTAILQKNEKDEEEVKNLISEAGLIRLPNGQYIKRGEKGEKGETGKM